MKISYAILTHNEGIYIDTLLKFLIEHKRDIDEIVVVDDYSDDIETVKILEKYKDKIFLYYNRLNGDFSNQKNFLISKCTGDWIFNIDADEMVTPYLMECLYLILKINTDVDVIYVPRINIVNGIEFEHIERWKWNVDNKGRINFPDWQGRIHKRIDNIKWVGRVHEKLSGYKKVSNLPIDDDYCLIHIKDIKRQEKQNEMYERL
jgi:glycosyltransferase involved in cell wall biosynthesis